MASQNRFENNASDFYPPSLMFGSPSESERKRIQRQIALEYMTRFKASSKPFELRDPMRFLEEGVAVMIKDGLSECFEPNLDSRWDWNLCLKFMWCLGVWFRYMFMFPLRLIVLVLGAIIFFTGFFLTYFFVKKGKRQVDIFRKLAVFFCGVIIFTWTSVIKWHGEIPAHRPNQIYVANHTSMIDYILLCRKAPFAVLAQNYEGWLGFMQKTVIENTFGGIWFERFLPNDRKHSSQLLRDYISKKSYDKNRLIIFPEGTCVNNNFCIQFKKGAFELAEEICPVAIKYNNSFTDGYWNSRRKSFIRHLFDLMTSWALVVDIYFLEPQKAFPNESAADFSDRVKGLICEAADIENTDWNGYLKYLRPSPRFAEYRQRLFAKNLRRQLRAKNPRPRESAASGAEGEPFGGEVAANGAAESGAVGGRLQKRRVSVSSDEQIANPAADAEMRVFFESLKRRQKQSVLLNHTKNNAK